MAKFFSIILLLFMSCTAKEVSTQTGVFATAYTTSDSINKLIEIEFIENNLCKILVSYGGEIYDDIIYRYSVKGNWVMLKNMSTGKWLRLDYLKIDDNTFKLKLFETDSIKHWRFFHRVHKSNNKE